MSFTEAVKVCLTTKYFDFDGRASRSEYWWFVLALIILNFLLTSILGNPDPEVDGMTGATLVRSLINLALFAPSLGVQVRRLHDIGKGGQWVLLGFFPLLNLLLFYWAAKRSEQGTNRFGPQPIETL